MRASFSIITGRTNSAAPPPGPTNVVLINLAGTSGNYITPNWNNILQDFASGTQVIKGDNSGDTLTSLRKDDGTLTGFQVVMNSVFQGSNIGQQTAGVYPLNANWDCWLNPGSSGTSRSFRITGLDTGTTYYFKILASIDSGVSGNHNTTIAVSGGSGGGTFTDVPVKGNSTNIFEYAGCVPNGSGEITVTVTRTATGQAPINVIEINW